MEDARYSLYVISPMRARRWEWGKEHGIGIRGEEQAPREATARLWVSGGAGLASKGAGQGG